jgi:putative transposase
MRHNQSTLKASTVHAHARRLLQDELEMADYSPTLPAALVVSLLLLASCWQTSLSGACGLVKDPPCRETLRQAALATLPPRSRDLLDRLLRALRRTLPDHLRRLPQVMALDLHQRPFYGNKKGRRKTRGTTRRQKKAGTRHSFTYATLAVLTRWGRFTVGLLPTRPHMRLTTIVKELLLQAEQAGLSISYLMLDKEFYAAEVIDMLQKAGVPFLMPASHKPSNKHLYDPKTAVGWYEYSWTAPLMRYNAKTKKRGKKGKITVKVQACVARNKDGEPLVYVGHGLGKRFSPAQVVQMYRGRFGIEASYRQLGQCLARTSSRNERYRLLLVGVALLLCNLWSYLHSEVFSTGPLGETRLELAHMRLLHLRVAVAADIAALFGGYISEWATQRPLPEPLMHET